MAMTKNKINDGWKEMKESELLKNLAILQEEARLIRFKAEGSRSKNVKEMATLKKQIARVMTQMNQAK